MLHAQTLCSGMQRLPVTPVTQEVSSAPKTKRAKTNRADDAQVLSLESFLCMHQPPLAQDFCTSPQQGDTMTNADGRQQCPFSSEHLSNKALLSGVSCHEGSVQSQPQQAWSELAALAKDYTMQVLQISGFAKYTVISKTLHKAELTGSSSASDLASNGVQAQHLSEALRAAITSVQRLSAHNVNVLTVDLQLSECYQSFHAIGFSSKMNR